MHLTPDELTRYHRQIMLIGEEGQKKIKQASILLAGLGGLGSISAYYLVAAGVGHLRIVDKDIVHLDNLNRQILHWTSDIGRLKSESAGDKLRRLNPLCRIEAFPEELTETNVAEFVRGCSLIVDGTDNLSTRKVLNRAFHRASVPFVFGGVEGWNGMMSTFVPGETGCLECLFAHLPAQKKDFAVAGPLPGLIASLQVLEAMKLILGMEGVLKNRLLWVRGTDMTFHITHIGKNPNCELCNHGTEND